MIGIWKSSFSKVALLVSRKHTELFANCRSEQHKAEKLNLLLLVSILFTVRRKRLETPFRKVITAMKTLKLPILSASIPAAGGANTSARGTAVLTIEASSMVKPRDLIQKIMRFSKNKPAMWFFTLNAQWGKDKGSPSWLTEAWKLISPKANGAFWNLSRTTGSPKSQRWRIKQN